MRIYETTGEPMDSPVVGYSFWRLIVKALARQRIHLPVMAFVLRLLSGRIRMCTTDSMADNLHGCISVIICQCEFIFQAFGDVDFTRIRYKDSFKIITFFPETGCFFKSHNK